MTRGQHYANSQEYIAYQKSLANQPDLWCKFSEKYINWRQLEILGLMSKGQLGMSVGFVMLCHTALERAAEVARHWAERDCPVVIHVDKRVTKPVYDKLVAALADLENIRFSGRFACEWGTWGIVAATQTASGLMLQEFPEVRHVFLASGSCLPLRPVEELKSYLQSRPRVDFIESVTTEDVGWTIGGLNMERFTLRFPFSWRRQRKLFDGYVRMQRRLGFRRHVPEGLVPHLGSQWWCLTRQTLSAILESPEREEMDRYFRRVWIPDESYFQTLVRQYSTNVESRSLTLSKFDFQGKPHIFYDDHLQLLRRSDCFVARKIWPQAEKLYQTFLHGPAAGQAAAEPNPGKIDRLFSKAVERRVKGRAGLYMQSRMPNENFENGRTAAAYSVFEGFAELFENFEAWLGKIAGTRVHGHLFSPERAEFSGGETVFNGAMSDNAALRDYDAEKLSDQPDLEHAGRAAVLPVRAARYPGGQLVHRGRSQCPDLGDFGGVDHSAVPFEPEFQRHPARGGGAAKDRGGSSGGSALALDQGAGQDLDAGRVCRKPDGAAAKHHRRDQPALACAV